MRARVATKPGAQVSACAAEWTGNQGAWVARSSQPSRWGCLAGLISHYSSGIPQNFAGRIELPAAAAGRAEVAMY
jgi:hypothetical protein